MLVRDGGKVRETKTIKYSKIFNKTLSTGTRPNGETGLFPEAYVEEIKDDGPPAMAPPPLPQVLIFTYIITFVYHFQALLLI